MKTISKMLIAGAIILGSHNIFAQECTIPMSVVVDEGFANITPEACSALESQLQRLATQSKLDIGWNNSHFAITAKFDQMDRYIVGSAPAQIANSFGVTLYIADVYNQRMFNSTYFEVKGVGTNEVKASMDAVKRLNGNNVSIKKFLQDSKMQIINYYDSQLPAILKEAEAKASMKDYGSAMALLAVIPSCCNGYEQAMAAAKKYYVLYRDEYFQKRVNIAKALWASNPTVEGSREVVAILSSVDPDAKCYPEAMQILSQIAKVVKTDIDYETKKKYEDQVALEKLRIQAIAEIGKAHAENQPKVNILFLGNGAGVVNSQAVHGTSISNVPTNTTMLSDNSQKLSGSDIFQKYSSAVFTIHVPSMDGNSVSQGSGFFINSSGMAVTNYHVLADGNLKGATISIPGTNTNYSIASVVKSSKENDYAVFTVNCNNNNFIPVSSIKPNVGDKVFAIGSPKGFTNTFSSGEISQWRGAYMMQTTVMIDHGSSGGALINEAGEVVGITSGTFDAESVANLNYAISIDIIK